MKDRPHIQDACRILCLLWASIWCSPAWSDVCVRSTYAASPSHPLYVDLSPFPSPDEQLGPSVLQLSLSHLRASRAFRHRNLVLVIDSDSEDEREAVCAQLKADGFEQVIFLREPSSQLRMVGKRLVLRQLPEHGWRTLEPPDAHRMLGSTEYLAVKLGRHDAENEKEGFVAIASLEKLLDMADQESRQIMVFSEHAASQPPTLPPELRHGRLWWVEGGLTAFRQYQTQLTLSLLARKTPERMCPL